MPQINVPDDLSTLEQDALNRLADDLAEQYRQRREQVGDQPSADDLRELEALAGQIEQVRGEQTARQQAARENADRIAALDQRVSGTDQPDGDGGDGDDPPADGNGEGDGASGDRDREGDLEPAMASAVTAATTAMAAALAPVLDRLADRLPAPAPPPPRQAPAVIRRRGDDAPPERLAITAGADIPDYPRGGDVPDLDTLVRVVQRRAASMPVTHTRLPGGQPVGYDAFPAAIAATVHEDSYDFVIDNRTPMAEVGDHIRELRRRDRTDALLAGGGWCAPPEVRYDFFDVACEDGLVDLPTVGVRRGGIQVPTSPTMADVFTGDFDVTTNPWLWTEDSDIAVVTGGPSKPCVRVPCPDFTTYTLECYGVCLTAGNLTDDAYPEATAHYLGLLTSAHARAMNMRYLQTMALLSTSPCVSGGGYGTGGGGAAAPLLGGVELAAIDYRYRYGMCSNDVLEIILPEWAKGVMRADLARRSGVDLTDVSDARLLASFAMRGVRPQFVRDWQSLADGLPGGATPLTAWPTSVQFLIYAAGTFLLGNGLSLDLGIVRDSTLNADNDHTAAWFEECHLIARVGPESRCYTLAWCPDGTTGAADLTACGL